LFDKTYKDREWTKSRNGTKQYINIYIHGTPMRPWPYAWHNTSRWLTPIQLWILLLYQKKSMGIVGNTCKEKSDWQSIFRFILCKVEIKKGELTLGHTIPWCFPAARIYEKREAKLRARDFNSSKLDKSANRVIVWSASKDRKDSATSSSWAYNRPIT
jgi:hypothetical protein